MGSGHSLGNSPRNTSVTCDKSRGELRCALTQKFRSRTRQIHGHVDAGRLLRTGTWFLVLDCRLRGLRVVVHERLYVRRPGTRGALEEMTHELARIHVVRVKQSLFASTVQVSE